MYFAADVVIEWEHIQALFLPFTQNVLGRLQPLSDPQQL